MPGTSLYYANGYNAWPSNRLYPQAGTEAEIEYLEGWHQANSEADLSETEWEWGRETFAAKYIKIIEENA